MTWSLLTEAYERLLTESGESLVTENAPVAWPGTAGGADSPAWGPNIRLYVWASIRAGTTMHWGPDATSRLDSGNVWAASGSVTPPGVPPVSERLWIDLTCDTLEVETHLGGSSAEGPMVRVDAGTATLTLFDPARIYDPLNPSGPYQYGGITRLGPGIQIKVWAEVLTGSSTITTYWLHTGTVDSWTEQWEPSPTKRRAVVVSSDAVKDLVNLDRGEQPPVGAGDTTTQRVERILTYYGWAGTRNLDTSSVTEQATTLAQSAWELISRTADDEIGMVWISPTGVLQMRSRATWTQGSDPVLSVGCAPSPAPWDIAVDAQVSAAGRLFKNAAYVARTGGTQQIARSDTSIQLYGERDLKRTDLGHSADPVTATWASFIVSLIGWPRARIEDITLAPGLVPGSWPDVLGVDLVTDRIAVHWQPADATEAVEATGRAVGIDHTIQRHGWETKFSLALADVYGRTLHWGTHPFDQLNRGNVYGL